MSTNLPTLLPAIPPANSPEALPAAPHDRFAYLDAIRGIAAIFVLLRHAAPLLVIPFHRSYLAVDVFFLLSGFVIAHAYDDRLRGGTMSARSFMALRLIRLYPVYLLALVLSLAVMAGMPWGADRPGAASDIVQATVLASLFLPARMEGYTALFPINSPCWSLFFELLVNLAYAAARPLLSDRVLLAIAGTAAAAAAVLASRCGNLDLGYNWQPVSVGGGLARATFGFTTGLLVHRHRARLFAAVRALPWLSPWMGVLLAVAVLCSPALPRANWLADLACVFAILPVAVIVAASGHPATPSLARLLVAIGVASYPIYVLHRPVINVVLLSMHGVPAPGPAIAGAAMVLLLFALALQVDRHYDVPLRRWLRRRI